MFAQLAKSKGKAVLYFSDMIKFSDIEKIPSNRFEDLEKEIVLSILPENFVERATEITLDQAKSIFKTMGIEVPTNVTKLNMNRMLEQTKKLTEDQINEFVEKAREL